MRKTIGRRALFFLVTALICAVLVPVTPDAYRWVAWFATALALFWGVALALENLTIPGPEVTARPRTITTSSPFEPPPPPGGAS